VRVLLASNNGHKLTEVRAILGPLGAEVISPAELKLALDVLEDGDTFEANAVKKAEAFRDASGLTVLADDSGLEVDALGGQPGVLSARYAGPGASDADRVALLLRSLVGVPARSRTARFVCAVAIASPGRATTMAELTPDSKNRISHRARAFRAASVLLSDHSAAG